jgi:Prolyl oligopeptidase family
VLRSCVIRRLACSCVHAVAIGLCFALSTLASFAAAAPRSRNRAADPDRLAIRGWRCGGILGGSTITQTSRFKAASLGAMVTDWTSEYAMGFNHDVRLWYIGADLVGERGRLLPPVVVHS